MNVTLDFNINGTFNCNGLAGTRTVRIGGLGEGEAGCESCPRFSRCGMSHTSEISTQIKDIAAIIAACTELGLPHPQRETVKLYDGQEHSGIAVRLPGWKYPVIIDTKTGQLHYDNFNGSWGKEQELSRLKQSYGIAKATAIARSKGYMINRVTLQNGTVKLTVSGM